MKMQVMKTFFAAASPRVASAVAALAACAAGLTAAPAASAATLEVDLNDFSVRSELLGGGQYQLFLFDDPNTMLSEIRVDGNPAPGAYDAFAGVSSANFDAQVSLSGSAAFGNVTDGEFILTDDQGVSITFDDVTGVYVDSGNRIELVMFLNSTTGEISGDTFSGADVSSVSQYAPLDVSVITFYFDRRLLTGAATDITADLDLTITAIPEPATLAGVGLAGGLVLLRRRRA